MSKNCQAHSHCVCLTFHFCVKDLKASAYHRRIYFHSAWQRGWLHHHEFGTKQIVMVEEEVVYLPAVRCQKRDRERLRRPHLASRTSSNNTKSSLQETLGVLILNCNTERKWVPWSKTLLFPETLLILRKMEWMGSGCSWWQLMRWPFGSSYWEWEDLCFHGPKVKETNSSYRTEMAMMKL